jgi:hypothetical protein
MGRVRVGSHGVCTCDDGVPPHGLANKEAEPRAWSKRRDFDVHTAVTLRRARREASVCQRLQRRDQRSNPFAAFGLSEEAGKRRALESFGDVRGWGAQPRAPAQTCHPRYQRGVSAAAQICRGKARMFECAIWRWAYMEARGPMGRTWRRGVPWGVRVGGVPWGVHGGELLLEATRLEGTRGRPLVIGLPY